jgi:hypothetical protein
MKTLELTEIQKQMVETGTEILRKHKILYLMFETQVGKTPTSLKIAENISKDILFITKKKMIAEIPAYLANFAITAKVKAISMDSIHKEQYVKNRVVITDEAHSFGAYPKPTKRCKDLMKIVKDNHIIFLSATPTPEKFSQFYHQLAVSHYSPFNKYRNFYRWADDFVTVTEKYINGIPRKCYDNAKIDKINENIEHLKLTLTKEEAGFKQTLIKETVYNVPMSDDIEKIYKFIKRDRVLDLNGHTILGDTPVKLMTKLHQLCGGTIITEEGKTLYLDRNKVDFINKHFANKKIAVFYKFDGERELLEKMLDRPTTKDVKAFRESAGELIFISQFQSGREGISLATADYLIFYNIPHSYLDYEQSRNRVTNMNRESQPEVVFLLTTFGIDKKILKVVKNKKQYTARHFLADIKEM